MVSLVATGALHAALTAAILSCVTWGTWRLARTWWLAREFPGPAAWPLIGNFFDIYQDQEALFNMIINVMSSYGSVARIWIGPQLGIVVGSAEDSRRVLNHPKVVSRDSAICHLVDGFIDGSTVSVSGEVAQSRRKLLTPAFHLKCLQEYFQVFNRKAGHMCTSLAYIADGTTVDVKDQVSVSLLDAFFETFFGVDLGWPSEEWAAASSEIVEANDLVFKRGYNPLLLPTWAYNLSPSGKRMKIIRANFKARFQEGLARYIHLETSTDRSDAPRKPCMLNIIYETMSATGIQLSEEEIREECFFMSMAVIETTAKAMAYTLILLGMNPEVQEEVFQEQYDIFQDSKRPANREDIKKMPVLEGAMKEAMRLFPPIGGLTRQIVTDVPISQGRVIPAGSSVIVSNFFVHRDPANFQQPERFWPDRWKAENSVGRHPFAYFPFGGGARQCIGQKYSMMQMRVTFSALLRGFRFTSKYSMKDLRRLELNLSNVSAVGYDVQVYRRDNETELT